MNLFIVHSVKSKEFATPQYLPEENKIENGK